MSGQAFIAGSRALRSAMVAPVDVWLLGTAIVILVFGLVMVASVSVTVADRMVGAPLYFFWRQMIYAVLGVALAAGITQIPLQFWRLASAWLLLLGIVLLIAVLVPGVGREVNGSMRWLLIGQPSEFMKLAVTLYMAAYLVRRADAVRETLGGFLRPIALLVFIAMLLLMEPDFGATVVMFATVLGMLFLGGVPLTRFFGWVGVVVIVLGGIVMLESYRLERLMVFMNPWADPYQHGFQLTQALVALGSGGWFGVGLGASVQKLFYLPEAHTDFLISILGEELGLAGSLAVIALYTFLLWRAFLIGRHAEQRNRLYGAYLAYGLAMSLGLQAYTNIGVNMGLLPTKGLTLPLMSYGGSSLIIVCISIGLLLRVDIENRQDEGTTYGASRTVAAGAPIGRRTGGRR